MLARRGRRQVFAIGQRYQCQGAVEIKAVKRFTVGEDWSICRVILQSGGRGREGIVSGCAMAWRVSDALTPTMYHLHRSSDLPMLRDHARRNEEASGLFVGPTERTGSAPTFQSLLLRPPLLQERVANDVTFPAC